LRARTGSTFVPDHEHWSAWQTLPSTATLENPTGRFLQLELELATNDPLTTPRLEHISVSADPRGDDWTAGLKVVESDNEPVVRSAIPFEYESYRHPKLQQLRKEYQLDELVRGARTELELMSRLAVWSATQWSKGHLKDIYPAWDALEILKPHADGTPVGGFCQQHNLVFLQACESFGLPGRAVSIGQGALANHIRGGHETVEIWSNDFRKWIYFDGDTAWYALDRASRQPLSLRELRERQVAHLRGDDYPPIEVVHLLDDGRRWTDLGSWPPLVELRLVPRSNFLAQASPLPLNQGMRGWFWTGHYVWSDSLAPDTPLYAHRVARRGDLEWTLNHAHMVLEAKPRSGELRVHLDSVTPGLKSYLAAFDETAPKPVAPLFDWTLHPGRNQLRVWPVNDAGRQGIASIIEIESP
jgi:hypothetical protein